MASVDEMRLVTAIWAPGAVTANAETTIPANYPEVEELLGGLHMTSTGSALTGTDLTAIAATATPGAGNISKTGGNTFRIGTTCDTKTKLVVLYRAVSAVNDEKYVTAFWLPGATISADTDMNMPAIYPEIEEIIGGSHLTQATDDITEIEVAAAVPTTTLGSGYVSKTDGNTIKMGDANSTSTMVMLVYRAV